MHVRRMIANAGYSPPAVAGLTQAFDDAWEEISARVQAEPDAERVRFKLAGIIMLMGRHVTDLIELRQVAVRIVARSEGWEV